MKTKVLQVFYNENGLPFKDQARTVHFPITGSGFQGASNSTQIKFYYKELGDSSVSWVAVAKLPNGKVGSKVLQTYSDSELGEPYALLELNSFYTQYKGDVFISLQGYQGGVNVEYNDDDDLYEIHGTPTIQATGSIKFTNNYATQFVGSGENVDDITLQQIYAMFGSKLDIDNGIYVTPTLTGLSASTFEDGQIILAKDTNTYYKVYDVSFVKVDNGLLGSYKYAIPRFNFRGMPQLTVAELYDLVGSNFFVITINNPNEYIACIKPNNTKFNVSVFDFSSSPNLQSWYKENVNGSEYVTDILTSDNARAFVPYSGATTNLDLGNHNITAQGLYLKSAKGTLGEFIDNNPGDNTKFDLKIASSWGKLILDADSIVEYRNYEIANKNYVDNNVFIMTAQTMNLTDEQFNYLKNNNVRIKFGYMYFVKTMRDLYDPSLASDTWVCPAIIASWGSDDYTTVKYLSITLSYANRTLTYAENIYFQLYKKDQADDRFATKQEVADGYVSKTTGANKVYGTNGSGNQTTYNISQSATANNIVQRTSGGKINAGIAGSTFSNTDAVNKYYVDQAIATAISTVYKFQGTKTVAQLNALTGQATGDVYNVSDSGTLNAGSVSVVAGDNVVWTGSAWDKLAGEIDLSGYYNKTQVDTLLSAKADISTTVVDSDVIVSGGYVSQINKGGTNYPVAQQVDVTTIPKVVQSTSNLPATNDGYLYLVLDNGYLYHYVSGTGWVQAYQYTSDLLTITEVTVEED